MNSMLTYLVPLMAVCGHLLSLRPGQYWTFARLVL